MSGEYKGRVRMTLTVHAVNAARRRLVLATGHAKADVIERWLLHDHALPVESGQSHQHRGRARLRSRSTIAVPGSLASGDDGHHDDTRVVGAAVDAHDRLTCARCSPTIPTRSTRYRAAGRRSVDRLLEEPDRRRGRAPIAGRGRRCRCRGAPGGDVRRASPSTSPSDARCCTPRCVRPADAVVEVDGHNVVPDVHEVLGRMTTFADRVRSGAWRGATGEAMRDRRQHRHRWQRPRPGDGVPGHRVVRRSQPAVPLRQQRRRRRHHRQPRRSRSGDHAVHRQLEDVHDDRDADQRHQARRTG